MPFTFAHPAAVLPIKKAGPVWLDTTALVLGSMAPDFEYFIRFKAQGVIGHTLPGFILLNLPLVLLLAFLWHYIIKTTFIPSLAKPLQRIFISLGNSKFNISSFSGFLAFVLSALTGMATHVLWDSFTHIDGYFVGKIPFLSYCISIYSLEIPVYKVLQHGSTLAGLFIIILYLYIYNRKSNFFIPEMPYVKKLVYWLSVFLITAIVVILRTLTVAVTGLSLFGIFTVTSISGFLTGNLIVSVVYKVFNIYDT
ncbi:MAG: hypothetical protein K0R50_3515 [Eubacterium sp.]|nr:hypothetical protein [Eubacterium sp.]